MTANWSKSNRSWRARDRQRLGLAKHGGLLAQVFDGEHPRTAAVAALLLASLHLYLAGLFQRHAPEPYMVRTASPACGLGRSPLLPSRERPRSAAASGPFEQAQAVARGAEPPPPCCYCCCSPRALSHIDPPHARSTPTHRTSTFTRSRPGPSAMASGVGLGFFCGGHCCCRWRRTDVDMTSTVPTHHQNTHTPPWLFSNPFLLFRPALPFPAAHADELHPSPVLWNKQARGTPRSRRPQGSTWWVPLFVGRGARCRLWFVAAAPAPPLSARRGSPSSPTCARSTRPSTLARSCSPTASCTAPAR
jgi:hypothetical protein